MKNFLTTLLFVSIVCLSPYSYAKGGWEFFSYDEYCFIQSAPIKTEIPEGKSRGDNGIIVYKMHKSSDIIVQISPGFDYKSADSVEVKIDNGEYEFYTDTDVAWSRDDKKTIFAMKKGLELISIGISSKGTKVVDTFSLKGFTSAISKLTNDC